MRVRGLMTRQIFTVRIGCLGVLSEGKLVGVSTEHDPLRLIEALRVRP